MEREIINFSEISDYKSLFFEGCAGYNEETDTFLYEVIKEDISYYDLEQGYLYRDIIFRRTSDNKYFTCQFKEGSYRNDFPDTASQVFAEVIYVTDTRFY